MVDDLPVGGGGKSGLLHLQSVPHSIGDPLPILQQARHKERDFLGAKLSEIILRLLAIIRHLSFMFWHIFWQAAE